MTVTDAELTEAGPLGSHRQEDVGPARKPVSTPLWRRVMRRAVLQQFIQFCLVGALSTTIFITVFSQLMGRGLGPNLSHVIAFSLAVTNGFLLNRAWTFRRARSLKMERQYVMFIAVNLVGLVLSWSIMRLVGFLLLTTGSAEASAQVFQSWTGRQPVVEHWAYVLGELTATPVCAVWNFSANRLWTFGGAKRKS